MLRIGLKEKKTSPNSAKNRLSSAEYNVRKKNAYLYPNDWGLDHYKEIACLENHPNNISKKFIEKSEPFRDELTPTDCWISFSNEQFLPNPNTYAISYHCTPLMKIPNGWGGVVFLLITEDGR